MKKILSALVCSLALATTASADFVKVEMGAGTWMQTPSGQINYTDTGVAFADVSKENSQTQGYAWLLVKHPIPILPNLRLEYVNIVNDGEYVVQIGTPVNNISTGAASNLEMTQFDIIPYYNILDNTAWVTLDLGLDFKVINISYSASGIDILDALDVDITTVVVPLCYVRARVQVPATNFGIEADVKYISYDSNTVSDIRIKADYTFDFFPVIQPAIEIGYRIQTFDLQESGYKMDTDYKGIYAGLMVRF